MVTEGYLYKHPGLRRPFDLGNANSGLSTAEDQPKKHRRKVSNSFTAAYYQAIKGTSVARFEGSSNALPLDLKVYGIIDLESKSKKPDFESFFGDFKLWEEIYRGLSVSTRSSVISGKRDIARLGLRYAREFKKGDEFSAEFYPLETDERQTVYVYGMKKLKGGKFFIDALFKGTLDDFKTLERFYSEIGCGVSIIKRLEGVVQLRLASNDYIALLMGLRYTL